MQEDFGQEVMLTVHDETGGKVVFDAAGLRIDFDVRQIDGFNRGTFTLFNLEDSTIKAISNGENYVTVKTRLHGAQDFTVANSFYVSNVLEEKKLPESITTLYCYSKLRKDVLQTQINAGTQSPTLERCMATIAKAGGFSGKIVYRSFPIGKTTQTTLRPFAVHQGSVQECITQLQGAYKFKFYQTNDNFICMYMPDASEVGVSDLSTRGADVVLNVNNMRSNPKIGPATLTVTSNLDGNIAPAAVLDTSELLTVGVQDATDETLQLSEGFLQDTVAGFTKYQTLAVQHKGSNYTSEWKTIATATSPTKGTNMPTLSWHKGK